MEEILFKRSCYCGDVNISRRGEEIDLCGWVHRRRDLGGVIFLDIRDRNGIIQVVFNPESQPVAFAVADKARIEYVMYIHGVVAKRPEGSENTSISTGEIEIIADKAEILNPSLTPPFSVTDDKPIDENVRLKYRYIDLRRPMNLEAFKNRHKITMSIRKFLDSREFLDVETPTMTRSTPEGARDYLVPSRVNPAKFYALAQSPQLFKQLLMVAGFDKYYQIARCFRDEDLRADRQPEFTQIDIEMSFVNREDIFKVIEDMLAVVFRESLGIELPLPFPRLAHAEAMERYGSDKPDTRFGMEIVDITGILENTDFGIIRTAIDNGGAVKGMTFKGGANFSRKETDSIAEKAKALGAQGLFFIAYGEQEIKSSLLKHLGEEKIKAILDMAGAEKGDLFMFAADAGTKLREMLGRLRLELGHLYNLIPQDKFSFLWVIDFPLFVKNESGGLTAEHHPFTSPLPEDIRYLESDPARTRAAAYDVVLNGYELGSGSIRIHRREIQERIFELMGLTDEQIRDRFGFLLDAFEYGAPPHGGIALGLDRLCAIMSGKDSIREVVAFPKNLSAVCPLTGSPMYIEQEHLDILHIKAEVPVEANAGKA